MRAATDTVNDVYFIDDYRPFPTLLVIDDDPRIASGLERSLRGQATLLSATDGYGGRDIANARQDLDLIVLDLTMPQYDAIELLKDLREDDVQLPIVLMSGWNAAMLSTVRSLADALGFNVLDAVEKPFESVRLMEVIKKLGPTVGGEQCARNAI